MALHTAPTPDGREYRGEAGERQTHGRRFTIPLPVIAQFYARARLAQVIW